MNPIDTLKVEAYDILAQIEAHSQKIQELKDKLININEQIKSLYDAGNDTGELDS